MLTVDWFKNKRVTLMGLGLHGGGLGAALWLFRHGAKLTVTDLKDQHALAPSMADLERAYIQESRRQGKQAIHRIRYVLGRHEDADFSRTDLVIQNPDVRRENPFLAFAKQHGVPIESEISLFFQLCPWPITAVSGSKGKTTVATLLGAICKAQDSRTVIAGNLRKSALDSLDAILRWRQPSPIVLELSSWQLESLAPHRLSPQVGILTNVLPDHLNRYDGIEHYAEAKSFIVKFQLGNDVAVLNADDRRVAAMGAKAQSAKRKVIFFSLKKKLRDGWFVREGKIFFAQKGMRTVFMSIASLKVKGAHNVMNVMAACAAARALDIPLATVRKVARAFAGVPYRLETVAIKKGVRFVNDTTATMPDAAVAALETLSESRSLSSWKRPRGTLSRIHVKKIILIAGGVDKKLEFEAWAKSIKKYVKHLVLFDGTATEKMEAALAAAKVNVSTAGARNMAEAVREARRHTKSGDVVLLSPGCASFGLFRHEFDRGDQFNREVKKIK